MTNLSKKTARAKGLFWVMLLVSISTPLTALAAIPIEVKNFINKLSDAILNPIIYLLFALAFLYFLWGVVEFISKLDNETERLRGGRHMLWGIIGMAIMISAKVIMTIAENLLK